MADYWRLVEKTDPRFSAFPAPVKRPRTDFGGYLSQETHFDERDSRTSDLLRNGMGFGPSSVLPGPEMGLAVTPGIGMGAMASGGLGSLGAPTLDDTRLMGTGLRPIGLDPALSKPGGLSLNGGNYVGRPEASVLRPSLLPADATSTLFVEGIPTDCSRREAAHIFRPFIGFKEVRLVQKDPKRPGGEKLVLCFVEFTDPRFAAITLEALQGYKFDESDRDSPALKLQFARVLGPRGGGRDDFRGGRN
eukprot:c18065_g1_i1 orf=566-1309(-)